MAIYYYVRNAYPKQGKAIEREVVDLVYFTIGGRTLRNLSLAQTTIGTTPMINCVPLCLGAKNVNTRSK